MKSGRYNQLFIYDSVPTDAYQAKNENLTKTTKLKEVSTAAMVIREQQQQTKRARKAAAAIGKKQSASVSGQQQELKKSSMHGEAWMDREEGAARVEDENEMR